MLRSPRPYALGLSFAAAAFLQTGMVAVLAAILAMRIGASEVQAHSFGLVAMTCNLIGALLVGPLLNRNIPAWVIGICGLLLAAAGALALRMIVSDLSSAILVDCALMFGCGLLAGMWALLPRVAPSPETVGATSGLVTQITLIGVVAGPPAAFAVLGAGPFGFVILVGVLLIGSAAAVPIWLGRLTPSAAAARHHPAEALH